MEENEYRSAYSAINELRCAFEKAILSRQCDCAIATRFCLADREGVSCNAAPAQALCRQLLQNLRAKAIFALKLTHLGGPLPHAKEIRVQCGGMLGLQRAMQPGFMDARVENVRQLVTSAIQQYGGVDDLPYQEIIKGIVTYKGRRKRRDSNPNDP